MFYDSGENYNFYGGTMNYKFMIVMVDDLMYEVPSL